MYCGAGGLQGIDYYKNEFKHCGAPRSFILIFITIINEVC